MKLLKDKIKHIDDLRKKAMSNLDFVDMAKEHEQAIALSIDSNCCKRNSKRLSEIYSDSAFHSDHKY
ncbi:hypothetical protein [Vibrio lentus]|uniref:hypothetical protein n=1 Tax=Vibrio lentus TaxID=136468 RepID=UPI000C8546F4|nr:hypothetical protein [Vibrio lentus]PMG69457.1 hypothetical protein BCU86_09160 [Vibrio lentus]PMI49208.1 hypothetical protein BCU43_22235 [Vibrio lentus]PMI83478.1 hypothetical protein BCU36_23330 [Vibrio lentus]PMI90683.1 hypothetical protein BCU35_20535 [Vibrio lentus]